MLAGIELVLVALWWALGGNAQTMDVIKKLLFMMFWLWLVTNFAALAPVFVYSMVDAGISGAGGAAGGHAIILDPSRIFTAGVNAITPIMTMIETMDDWDQVGQVIILWISAFIILIAFAIVAIQVFLTVLEFYLFMGLSAILLPFGINKHTKFIAEKTLGGVVNYGVRLMVLAFILSVTEPTLTGSLTFTVVDGNVEWNEIFSVMVIAWAIALLSWNAPGVAAGLVSGSPSPVRRHCHPKYAGRHDCREVLPSAQPWALPVRLPGQRHALPGMPPQATSGAAPLPTVVPDKKYWVVWQERGRVWSGAAPNA